MRRERFCFRSQGFFRTEFVAAFSILSKKKEERFTTLFLFNFPPLFFFPSLLFNEMPPRTRRGAGAADESDGEKQVRFVSLFCFDWGLSLQATTRFSRGLSLRSHSLFALLMHTGHGEIEAKLEIERFEEIKLEKRNYREAFDGHFSTANTLFSFLYLDPTPKKTNSRKRSPASLQAVTFTARNKMLRELTKLTTTGAAGGPEARMRKRRCKS